MGVYTPAGGGGGGGSPPPAAQHRTASTSTLYFAKLHHNQTDSLSQIQYIPQCAVSHHTIRLKDTFLKKLPNPIESNVSKTVQGISRFWFEAKFEDMGVGSLVETNDKADITQTVYQGEGLQTITQSTISQYEDLATTNQIGAIISQQGKSYSKVILADNDGSMAETIISIRVDDIRPFALKGLDLEHEAHFDYTNGIRPPTGITLDTYPPKKNPELPQ